MLFDEDVLNVALDKLVGKFTSTFFGSNKNDK